MSIIKNSALAFLAIAALAGCANTPNQIREKPARVFTSPKPPELAAACISEQYDGNGASSLVEVTQRSDGGKTIKAKFGHAGTVRFVIDITPLPTGSKITFYENTLVQAFDRKYLAACGTPV